MISWHGHWMLIAWSIQIRSAFRGRWKKVFKKQKEHFSQNYSKTLIIWRIRLLGVPDRRVNKVIIRLIRLDRSIEHSTFKPKKVKISLNLLSKVKYFQIWKNKTTPRQHIWFVETFWWRTTTNNCSRNKTNKPN